MGDFKNSNLAPVKLIHGYPVTLNSMEPFHRLCVPSKKLEKADSNASTNACLT